MGNQSRESKNLSKDLNKLKSMKKTISSSIILFTLLAVVSACLSSSKMKNRHYQQWSKISDKKIELENDESSTIFIEPNTSIETEILNESISIHAIVPTENDNLNREESTINQSSRNKKASSFRENKGLNADYSLYDLKFNKKLKSSLYSSQNSAISDLSLLWIVIIVLIVLWVLGLIAGNFGGLIHLLLIIALILLILWLLRII
jgi:Flp pilus assembly protein TadB